MKQNDCVVSVLAVMVYYLVFKCGSYLIGFESTALLALAIIRVGIIDIGGEE